MTRQIDHADEFHGVTVADPYRWLEDDVRTSDEVAAWVAAQNEHTFAWLESVPQREEIRRRLTELWNYEKYSTPFKAGGRYFYFKNDGLQNQDVLYVQESLDGEPRTLIDPNTWSADGTVALAGVRASDDGRFLAYGVQDGGSDWRHWRVLELASGRLLDDQLEGIKFNTPAWTPDGAGLYYARYPQPEDGARFQNLNLNQQVYYHRVGTPQEEDRLIYERPDEPEWGFYCHVTEDGRYLVLTLWKGTADKYRVYYRDLAAGVDAPVVKLIDHFEQEFTFVGNDGGRLFFVTDLDAPRKRLIGIDLAAAAEASSPESTPPFEEVIPQGSGAIESVSLIGGRFVVESLRDAKTHVAVHLLDGTHVRDVDLPGIGSATGFGGRQDDPETFYTFSSFDTPPGSYRYDVATGESRLFRRAEVDVDPEDYEVSQVFYTSADGTRVPMFLAHRRGITLDGSNPTLLYGYGGFSISLTPYFSISRLAWMERGGVFAMANLRGGGEYGEEWHLAGTKLNKQNVFDDFIAAGEWLIDHGYTRPDRLAIQGGSNGGLLVGAVLNQRPDLFGAAIASVGVMDMLRFHRFTAGRFWVDDYGSADDADEFRALYAYSPYHKIQEGTCYPATLITTADTDDRVVPGHSFKYAARLQAAQGCENPILIRIETRAGHGAGTPTEKVIAEIADEWAFLARALRMSE